MDYRGGRIRRKIYFGTAILMLGLVLGMRCAQLPTGCGDETVTGIPQDSWLQVDGGQALEEGTKLVCLTFDDGPSPTTTQVLDILKEEQVPATFFVTAADHNREYLPLIARAVEEGHQIALHTAKHRYQDIYASTEAFWLDIKELRQSICHYVDLSTVTWLRFPGGSTNTVSHKYGGSSIMKDLKEQAREKGYQVIDWNVCAEDAVGGHPTASQILKNIKEDAQDKSVCVVLMHDTAATATTVQALPDIVSWFRSQGFTFCTVEEMARQTGQTGPA